ncbi:MAG: hypothetical protein JO084_19440 [Bradyrhizobiaceae bacterium]|nr:hypothetical protein [Bradyrhizobiaceae bacterium]
MPFQPGQSGNPAGRPPGARNKVNRMMEPAFQANGEAIIERLVEHAKAANPVALRLCVDRLVPLGKHRQIGFQLPPMRKADDVRAAIATIHAALGDGDISSGEAADLLRVAEISARMLREADNAPSGIAAQLARHEQALSLFCGMLGFDPASILGTTRQDEPAAEEAPAIVNNNAETMTEAALALAETETTPAMAADVPSASLADVPPETRPAIVNNNAETMAARPASPLEPLDLAGNNENAPDWRDEQPAAPLFAASG